MPSRSRAAAGANRYSARFFGMLGGHVSLEACRVEGLRIPARFTLDKLSANCLYFRVTRLVAADQITDVFAVIGETSGLDLRLDPLVLLVGDGNSLAGGSHLGLQGAALKIILLKQNSTILPGRSAAESRTRRESTAGASARASYSACWLLKVSLRHWPSAGDVFAPCPHGGQYHHDQERGGGDDERKADRARAEDRGGAVGDLQPPPQALSTS